MTFDEWKCADCGQYTIPFWRGLLNGREICGSCYEKTPECAVDKYKQRVREAIEKIDRGDYGDGVVQKTTLDALKEELGL